MNTDYTIRNFRGFNQKGATADIRPITIITGCNNSGKSSIVKSLVLLKDFCRQIESDYNDNRQIHLENYHIDFHKHPNDILGSFNSILHKSTPAEEEITETEDKDTKDHINLELVVFSHILMEYVKVKLSFYAIKSDDLNNGYLDYIEVRTFNDELICQCKKGGERSIDFTKVKKRILHFAVYQSALALWQQECSKASALNSEPAENVGGDLDTALKNCVNKYGEESVITATEWQRDENYRLRQQGKSFHIPIIENVHLLLDCPNEGVVSYFPVLSTLNEKTKADVINWMKILPKKYSSKMASWEKNAIETFAQRFEKSNSNTLTEYISNIEDRIFKISTQILSIGDAFSLPSSVLFHDHGNTIFPGDNYESIKSSSDTELMLVAMDSINKYEMDTDSSELDYDEFNCYHSHKLTSIFEQLEEMVLTDIEAHLMPGELLYTSTNIVTMKRLYSLEEDSEFVSLLKQYFFYKTQLTNKGAKYEPLSFSNKWLSELSIGNHVIINTIAERYGVTIEIADDKEETSVMSIADKGYGVTQLFAMLLRIEVAIMRNQYLDSPEFGKIIVPDVDITGLSNNFTSLLHTRSQLNPSTVALEEPENHLHPSMQSKLADIIFDANKEYGVHFMVETHSEYLVRKLQVLVREKKINTEGISLLYVYGEDVPKYSNRIVKINIRENGTLDRSFGPGFFDESTILTDSLYSQNYDNNTNK